MGVSLSIGAILLLLFIAVLYRRGISLDTKSNTR